METQLRRYQFSYVEQLTNDVKWIILSAESPWRARQFLRNKCAVNKILTEKEL